jgi:O-antigen ligase
LAAIALVGYFVLPGWLGAALVLLEIGCVLFIFQRSLRSDVARLLENSHVRWMLLAVSAPLLAVTLVQAIHEELAWRRFEGPARLLLAAAVMLAFAVMRIDFSRTAVWVVPAGIFLCAAWLLHPGASSFYWDGRAATVFMDPISLSQHIVIFGFVAALLIERTPGQGLGLKLMLAAALGVGLVIAVQTHSRTGWGIVPVGAVLLVLKNARSRNQKLAMLLVLPVLLASTFFLVPEVHTRIARAIQDVTLYVNGGTKDTSLGIRLSLFRTNLTLFAMRPLAGWGYTATPDILAIPEIRKLYTPLFWHFWTTAGGHSEYLQSMMRMGIAGLLSRLVLLLVPVAVFIAAARSGDPVRRRNGYAGLVVVLGYAVGGLTVEVLNLSYSGSLFALLLAVFAAGAIPNPARATRAPYSPSELTGSRLVGT